MGTINLTFEESAAGKPKIPDGVAPRFPSKPTIRQEGDNLVMECQLEAHPMPEITWYRGDKRVEETTRIRHECKNIAKHKFLLTLTITNPSMNDGGLYRCNAFNPFGDSNANIDLNFETGEGEQPPPQSGPQKAAEPAKTHADGFPPTFTEKPRIVPNETGTLVTMKFKVRSKPKAEMQWFKGTQKIKEGAKFAVKYNTLGNDEYEIMLEKKPVEPEPEPEPEPAFKLPKKKVSRQIPKEEPKEEESPFGAIKLKKAERVQRTWDDAGLETVDLKHHEFERPPQDPESEGKSTVKLGKALECDLDEKEEK